MDSDMLRYEEVPLRATTREMLVLRQEGPPIHELNWSLEAMTFMPVGSSSSAIKSFPTRQEALTMAKLHNVAGPSPDLS